MKKARKALPLKNIEVEHPVHGKFLAEGVKDRMQAVQAAARAWGRQWSDIARACSFREVKPDGVDGAE